MVRADGMHLLYLCLWICLLVKASFAHSATTIQVIGPTDNQAAQTYRSSLQTLAPSDWDIHFSPDTYKAINPNSDSILICLGDLALEQICLQTKHRIIALFVTQDRLQKHIQASPNLELTGIYLDAPLDRQMRLAQLILPGANTAGILSSKPLNLATDSISNQSVRVFSLTDFDGLPRMLNEALSSSDYLLGIPDSKIYNSQDIRQILLTAYRRNRVLIGPSLAFVNAGGLATTYSTTADYARQTVEMILDFTNNNNFPSPEYAHYFAVAVNLQVAKSLNLIVLEAKDLQSRLQMLEVRP